MKTLIKEEEIMENKAALLLMSHGDFATEIIKSAELIIGKQDNYAT